MRQTVGALPWLLPGIALSLVVSFAVSRRVGLLLAVPQPVAGAMVLALGIILSATVTPLHGEFDFSSAALASCDLTRVGLAPLRDLVRLGDTSLNVLLFLPLGCAIGVISGSPHKAALVVAAIALPFAIEGLQLSIPFLGRGCQSADVFDNLTGLGMGLVVGTIARVVAQTTRGPRSERRPPSA